MQNHGEKVSLEAFGGNKDACDRERARIGASDDNSLIASEKADYSVAIEYNLSSLDIFRLVLRIHFILLFLPLLFVAGYTIVLISGRQVAWELYFYFTLFCLSILLVVYIYLSQYFIFKKLFYFYDPSIKYRADFSQSGINIYQGEGKNRTEYVYRDFIKCRETRKRIYLYFKYDRALIVNKQRFLIGNEQTLRTLLKESIFKFKSFKA